MKFLPFVLKHLRRNRLRTASTVFAMAVCIFLFCTLQTFLAAVNWSLESANASRIVTRHAVNIVFNVPLAYHDRIAAVPGVKRVATNSWFGGFLKAKKETRPKGPSARPDWSSFFANLAVEAETFLPMYPEFTLPDDQKKAFLEDRQGCVIGRGLADRFGWKVGDRFFLESFISPYRKADGPFEFVVEGIFDTDLARYPGTDTRLMLFHFQYLYEAVKGNSPNLGAGTYTVEVEDPSQAAAVGKAIDAAFANSDAETYTETEQAFRAGFVSMAGNLALLLNLIGVAVTFTILLVTANTMSMAVRERRTEIGVLKTLGFGNGLVMRLILAESALIGLMGGALGILLGRAMIRALPYLPMIGDAVRGFPKLGLSPVIASLAFGLAVTLGLAAGFVPALLASRARVTEMLRAV